jgi:hypothetical protein
MALQEGQLELVEMPQLLQEPPQLELRGLRGQEEQQQQLQV